MLGILWMAVLVILTGAGITFAVRRWGSGLCSITRNEFIVGTLICSLVIIPLTQFIGIKVARGNQVTFNEFWGGWETGTKHEKVPCDRDGPCAHEYSCDPYNHVHHESRQVYTGNDANGNAQYRTEYYTEDHTHYHECPYATEEWSFRVDTDFGGWYVVANGFTDNPQEWRRGSGIPAGVHRGVPAEWTAIKTRIDAGTPGGVTTRKQYKNYILASQNTILKRFSSDVERLRPLLPAMTKDVDGRYQAGKFHAVGVKADTAAWNEATLRFGGNLGSKRQGDLHVVAVDVAKAGNPDTYSNALEAYWTGKEFGKNALSKNGLVLVLGTDGTTVKWARSFTGMPIGNEAVATQTRSALKEVPFTPDAVLGVPTPKDSGDGAFSKVALSKPGFVRVCMLCNDKGESGGFSYLNSQIQPTKGQTRWIRVIAWFLCLIVWGIMLAVGFDTSYNLRTRYTSYTS